MEQFFTTGNVTKLFNISPQTVKNWCDEFAKYLSSSATPGDGKKRIFTLNDVRVLALVADYHKRGFRWDDAHLALVNGQVGEIPQETDIVNQPPPALLVSLRDKITDLETSIKKVESERDEYKGQVRLLEKQLDQRDERIVKLVEDNAELKAQIKRQ
ncbi:MAG: MerR family transcriptional regulator [Anaerolineae bacterium]